VSADLLAPAEPAPRTAVASGKRRRLALASLLVGAVAVGGGLFLTLGPEGKKKSHVGVDAQGRPIVQIDLKAPSRKPVLPAEAKAATADGAKAFVLYYFDALNYSLAHGDTDLLAHNTNAGCQLCTGYLLGIAKWKEQHIRLTGGLTVPAALAVGPFSTTEPVTFIATFLTSPATLTKADGSTADYPGGRTRGGVAVLFANGEWQMTEIVLDSSKAKETP
jgi:hypothetical protein